MPRIQRALRIFRFPWRSARDIRDEVDEELRFHLALRAEELEQRGLSPERARHEAVRQFGDLEATRRALRSAGRRAERASRIRALAGAIGRDVAYALRSLRRHSGFSLAATLILAIGIGSSVLVFSLLDTLVLRPLPLHEPDRLLKIGGRPPPDAQWTMQTVRLDVLRQWQSDAESFAQLGGFASPLVNWRGPDGPEQLAAGAVVGDLFAVLGAQMTVGRSFTAAERDSAPAVLSPSFWRRRFGTRPDVVGTTIEIDGVSHTIVGVLPPETGLPRFGGERLVWIPLSTAGDDVPVHAVGRLHAGVAASDATAELAGIQQRVEDERGVRPRAAGVIVQSMQQSRTEAVGTTLAALFGGSLLLLIIACANVGTLTLTRLIERRHELAVRASLGATRSRLLRQMVTEHLVLWTVAGAAGLALAGLGLRWLSTAERFAGAIPSVDVIAIDARVALFACGITLLTALLFASLPSLRAAQRSPVRALREDGTAVSSSRRAHGWRQLLVVCQVGLSTVLACGACLLAVSLAKLTSQPLGFAAAELLTFNLQLPALQYPDQAARSRFRRELLQRLRALPGVEAVATTSAVPLGTIVVGPVRVEAAELASEPQWAAFQAVDAGYFETAGIAVLAGRALAASDGPTDERVVVVNETLANKHFNGQDPLGRRIDGLRIVGVVADVKHAGLDFEYLPELFVPYEQVADDATAGALGASIFAVLRVPDAFAPTEHVLRDTVSAIDPDLPILERRSGEQLVAASASRAQLQATVMVAIAVLAVLLSAIGLYAALAQLVAQRRKEFGIRMAIGATPAHVLETVCRYGVVLGALGVCGGVAAALALARSVQSLLFGISAFDPAVLLGVALLMLGVAVAAAAVPAWRATRLSPTLAIRNR
jgi:putative ABC transport system permease protein